MLENYFVFLEQNVCLPQSTQTKTGLSSLLQHFLLQNLIKVNRVGIVLFFYEYSNKFIYLIGIDLKLW